MRRLLHRLVASVRHQSADRELTREMAAHLVLLEDEYRRRGMTPEEAQYAARRAMGGIEQAKEHQRDARAFRWLDDLRRDARDAMRSFGRNPGFTAVLVLTLGLGIGATATVFSMLDVLLLEPLPYPEHERLGLVFERRPSDGVERDRFAIREYQELMATQESFDLTALFTNEGRTLTGELAAERVGVIRTSSTLFAQLGAVPVHGRLLIDVDDGPGAPTRAVLGHGLWRRRFGADPTVVGSSITLDGQPIRVVGVLSSDFPAAAMRQWAGAGDVFLNLSHEFPESGVHTVVVRRAPGVSWDQAQADLGRIAT